MNVITDGHAAAWTSQLSAARRAVAEAGAAIRDQFGQRFINAYKGAHDVQLTADLIAQKVIVDELRDAYPGYGIVAEEDGLGRWGDEEFLWAVDPLDGTNNFGYGIAHCALAISLFHDEDVVLSVVADPLTDRTVHCVRGGRLEPAPVPAAAVPLHRATLSLVTGYAEDGRAWGHGFAGWMSERCKRVVNMWAPALDLALIACGALDAMVCRDAALLDVCAGMFLVAESGGHVLGMDGEPLTARRSMHERPVSFVAARSPVLAAELLERVRAYDALHRPAHERAVAG
ncbi:inositol monophosphatase family protein [Thermomonospora catenispora]|uniref:inositol monophosphatase family protein n=1 Tax=Thermomonospora catenispora TaxID=2493090 RepID=UPI0011247203|nr:inositol monophosphatase [Thermomonospora catenispora]TNY35883.1 inositol monophosphatase [Thermomonospora catenispora]